MTRYEKEFYEMFLNEFPKLVKSINGLKKEMSNLSDLLKNINHNLEIEDESDVIYETEDLDKSLPEVAYDTIVEYVLDKIKLGEDSVLSIVELIEEELIAVKVFKSRDNIYFDNLVQDILQEYIKRSEK